MLFRAIEARNRAVYKAMRWPRWVRKVQRRLGKRTRYSDVIAFKQVDQTCIQVWPHSTWRSVRHSTYVTRKGAGYVVEQWVVNVANNYGFYLDDIEAATVPQAFRAIYAAFGRLDPERVSAAYERLICL